MKGPGLVTIRHAPVDPSWRGKCYGVSDVPTELTAARAADAMEAALGAGEVSFDVVWSSDLVRCAGPAAELASRGRAADHREDVRLRELDHGAFEERTWEALHDHATEALAHWGRSWETAGPPGGESARGLERRVAAWARELDPGSRHLLVAHAGVQRSLLVSTGEVDWPEAMQLDLPHLTVRGIALAALGTSGPRSPDPRPR